MAEIKRTRVMLCIPAHDCKVTTSTCQSLIHAIGVASRAHAVNIDFENGNATICTARNLQLARAMHQGYDQIFFIDSDLGFQPDAVKRLIEYPEELVAGVYPYRADELSDKWPVKWKYEGGNKLVANENGLIETYGAATGFMRIKRSCVQKLIDAHPERLVYDHRAPGGCYYALFHNDIANGRFTGEDYHFCNLWMGIGGKCWIDPNISFEHLGMKGWRGNLSATLVQMGAEHEPAAEAEPETCAA